MYSHDTLQGCQRDSSLGLLREYTRVQGFASKVDRLVVDCNRIPDRSKHGGHLLTSDPAILPSTGLQALARMGSKYRPSPYPGMYSGASRDQVLAELKAPIAAYARSVEHRVGVAGSMNAWQAGVMHQLQHAVEGIPDGTPCKVSAIQS